jgi:hypothetical protein
MTVAYYISWMYECIKSIKMLYHVVSVYLNKKYISLHILVFGTPAWYHFPRTVSRLRRVTQPFVAKLFYLILICVILKPNLV